MHTVGRLLLKAGLLIGSLLIAGFGEESVAHSFTHNYISSSRSGFVTHYFISSGVENEAGTYRMLRAAEEEELQEKWRAYGLSSEVGMELLKFLRVSFNHAFMHSKSHSRKGTGWIGSRIGVGTYFVFSSPVGNLEIGGGGGVGRYEYQEGFDRAILIGANSHVGLGVNYFLSHTSSVYVRLKGATDSASYQSGAKLVENFEADNQAVTIGMTLWK